MNRRHALACIVAVTNLMLLPRTFAEAPILQQPPDIIIGDLEGAPLTGTDEFVYTDGLDLNTVFVSDDKSDLTEIKWSFFESSTEIEINGAVSLTGGEAAGAGPVIPPLGKRLDLVNTDVGETNASFVEDGDPLTLTLRDGNDVAGATAAPPYGWAGNINEPHTVTLYAADPNTFTERTFTVYSVDNTTDGMTGSLDPVSIPPFASWQLFSFGAFVNGGSGGLGGTGIFTGMTGLCLDATSTISTVTPNRAHGWFWQSPAPFVPLVKNKYYVARMNMSKSGQVNNPTQPPPAGQETTYDTIPVWDFVWSNVNTGVLPGYFNHGQNTGFVDAAGGSAGIGRPQGRTTYYSFYAPQATQTLPWKGELTGADAVDNQYSAFSVNAAGYGDMRFLFRLLDFDSNGANAMIDTGIICMETLEVASGDLPSLKASATATVYGSETPNFSASTHETIIFDDPTHIPLRAGEVVLVPNGDNSVTFDLAFTPQTTLNAGNAFGALGILQPDLLPLQADTIPPPGGGFNIENSAKSNPILHEADQLYLVRSKVRNEVNLFANTVPSPTTALGQSLDPFDALQMNVKSATSEQFQFSVTTRASPFDLGPRIMDRAFSPRHVAQTGGVAGEYTALWYSHNPSAADLINSFPGANQFRAWLFFINQNVIGTQRGFSASNYGPSGRDDFSVETLIVQKVPTPSLP